MKKNDPFRSQLASGLQGECAVPGDKSISHRALILSSQIKGTTRIIGLLEGEDVFCTAEALESLGVAIRKNGDVWEVEGVGIGGLKESKDVLDLGNSGTSARLLMGLVTPYPFSTFFTGDESLRKRPMGRVIVPLSKMGATITSGSGERLPLAVIGTAKPHAIRYESPVASAQLKSAILLAGLNTAGKTTVIEPQPTRDHTENMLKALGFGLEVNGNTISLSGKQQITKDNCEIIVPADPSSAAFPIVAALICPGSELLLKNICVNPLRTGLFITLKEMGANIVYKNERIVAGEKVADIAVAYGTLKGVGVPAQRAPSMIDEYPILAVAAAFAKGETVMHGLSELRVKESDRLNAIVESLAACGVETRAEGDTLHVTGGKAKGGATIRTNFDHRIAMAFLVMGMATKEPVEIDDGSAISTSFPNFVELMNSLGAHISSSRATLGTQNSPLVIAIDGPAASGKGTLARRIAEHFGLDYLDTGSLYRAVGMKLIYSGKDPNNKISAVEAARAIDADDLANPRLRQERIGQAASIVSAFPQVRQALLEFQRNFATGKKGAVLDGRDIGTVVCPEADFKFFLTATLYARAKRRHKELSGQGIEVVFESVLEDLRERDERDSQRAIAPLKPADDAILMDTSDMDASEVFKKACEVISAKIGK
jgi:3-phosphoshikimate 1-carboxyvinyltransferase